MSGMVSFPGIDVPDVFERGLPTALANLLACWWADDGRGVDSWLANVAQRLWLSGVWDERIDERVMHGNRARIVRLRRTRWTSRTGGMTNGGRDG